MAKDREDAAYGLTPREWLEADAVPLTPDVDLNDPEQRSAWMRANNEENHARWRELQSRRGGGGATTTGDGSGATMSATTVVPVRFLNAEQRALVRIARRQSVSVSDLVRRWVRAGLGEDVEPPERDRHREALGAAADAVVERITDEVRRLREIVVSSG